MRNPAGFETARRLTTVVLGLTLCVGTARAAGNCSPSRLMIVLDRSTSMRELLKGTTTSKWKAAQDAVGKIAGTYESTIDLGLMIFPSPDHCGPGAIVLEPLPYQAADIKAAVAIAPVPNAFTPMAQSIRAAIKDPLLTDLTRQPALLLITDGWQYCEPYDAATRMDPVGAVREAALLGIKVYVVGFGSAVDAWTLNTMAHASGTELAGCDPTGKDVTSPNKCYYQVDDQTQLDTALQAIAIKVSAELCDGLDNDCNGAVDDGLMRSCSTACGSGMESCDSGHWVDCDAVAPRTETCDGKDNDCNGAIDEGCDCAPMDQRECGSDVGACHKGSQTCAGNGHWGMDCAGATLPAAETCNQLDDDCNGIVDDPSPSLCPSGATCMDGVCKDNSFPMGGSDGGDAGAPAPGCGCRLGDSPPSPALALGLLLPVALLLRRRRRD